MPVEPSERTQLLDFKMLIGPRWVEQGSAGAMEHTNPANGRVQARFPVAGAVEVDEAVAAAQAAAAQWRSWSPDERRRVLGRIGALLRDNAATLGTISSLEGGNLYTERGAALAADWFDYYAGWIDKIHGEVHRPFGDRGLDYTLPEPVGVVAVIITWNGPLGFFGMSVAPALAAGCTVVLKAPELAPFSSAAFARLCLEAGLPAGVLNVVTGGPECGDALVRHGGIDKITFTGGTDTARIIAASAAQALTPMVMELGGKSANIVFADAEVDHAIALAARFTRASGQGCSLPTRLLVERSIYGQTVERLVDRVRGTVVGDPFDPGTTMGPVINNRACDRILSVIGAARNANAGELVLGGDRLGGALADGFFVAPTIFADVDNSSDLAQEEIFGPVLSVMAFDSEDEAVALANDTKFGLAAYVQTSNLTRAHRMAARLEAGNVHVNGSGPGPLSPATPFGGIKQSGYGRQGSRLGIEEFLSVKNVYLHL